jgi:putative hydrolase of the HAD superfamily
MPIQAVMFDLGDTLWHFPNFPDDTTYLAEASRRVRARLNEWGLDDGVACEDLILAIRRADREQTRAAEHSHGRSPDFAALVRQCAAEHGVFVDSGQAEALWDAWNVGGVFYGRVLFPDSIPTLEELRRRGFKLAAVTNRSLGGERFRDELRDCGMLDLFDAYAISCDDGWLKPHPALFRLAMESLNVRPDETAMVGDNLRADVMGAKALGMTAVWKRPPGAVQEPAALPNGVLAVADFTIDHPGELLSLPIVQ